MTPPQPSLRVLHIGKFYPPFVGGMENFIGDLLPNLERCGVTTAALVHGHEFGRTRAYVQDKKNRIYRVPSYGNLLFAPVSPAFPLYLLRLIATFKPDILHMHLPNISAFWAILLPPARRIPWIVQWQSDVVFSEIDFRLAAAYRPFEQSLLGKAKQIVVATPPYLSSSSALSKWKEKCLVIPLGLDEERLEKPRGDSLEWAEKMWQPGRMRVLAIGRLTYYKGHEVLIKATAKVPEIHTLIIGTGDLRDRLDNLVRTSGLNERVKLIGFLPDERLKALLATCDVLCLPSIERTEAFGLVLLEAMTFSKPVVVSNVAGSGMGWIVCHEKTGLHVAPNDVDDLSKALQLLFDEPERRQVMGSAGKRRFNELFRIEQTAEKVVSLYRKII